MLVDSYVSQSHVEHHASLIFKNRQTAYCTRTKIAEVAVEHAPFDIPGANFHVETHADTSVYAFILESTHSTTTLRTATP